MSDILVVNSTSAETRVALCEDGILSELYIERKRDRGVVGNVYKGKVLRVLPGMQAAFVDIAQEKAGFLHVSDFYDFKQDVAALDDDDIDEWPPPSRSLKSNSKRQRVDIQDVLKAGQEIVVQVAKGPMGTKGARLTGHVSIPGRYVVFMPTVSHIGISKRIDSERERKRLRRIVESVRPQGAGFIVRTVSQGVSEDKLKRDIELLVGQWGDMLEKFNRVKPPYLLYEEPDLMLRATRDLFTTDLEKLVIDDPRAYDRVQSFTQRFMPSFTNNVELYDSKEPIFDAYGIEIEINRSLQRTVDLPSGGHLVIDKTEALTAVDVNTGKFVGKTSSHEETIFKTNLEAAEEIVYQLRLRNIGGIIIIDFIDMEHAKNREKVYRTLEAALRRDKVTTNALNISEFGLVEMTRKRVRESLSQYLTEECPYCDGRGIVKTKETVAYEVLRAIKRDAVIPGRDMYVYAHDSVIDFLRFTEKHALREIEQDFSKRIHTYGDDDRHIEEFIVSHKPKARAESDAESASQGRAKAASKRRASR